MEYPINGARGKPLKVGSDDLLSPPFFVYTAMVPPEPPPNPTPDPGGNTFISATSVVAMLCICEASTCISFRYRVGRLPRQLNDGKPPGPLPVVICNPATFPCK